MEDKKIYEFEGEFYEEDIRRKPVVGDLVLGESESFK